MKEDLLLSRRSILLKGGKTLGAAFGLAALTAQVCTTGANVINETWCRGVQATDSDGRVYFDSVYPGWYQGRTTHIHVTVRVGGTERTFAVRPAVFPNLMYLKPWNMRGNIRLSMVDIEQRVVFPWMRLTWMPLAIG